MADNTLTFFLNGVKIECANPDPEVTLAHFIRHELKLTGTKVACGEGSCGACTVMLSSFHKTTNSIEHRTVNACLFPLVAVHGQAVVTVEGIGSVQSGVHPVQERLAKFHGTQCGYCSPGFVMSMYTLLRNRQLYDTLSEEVLEEAIQGNLCRCTGYRPIMDAFKSLANEVNGSAKCCLSNGTGQCPCSEEKPKQNGHASSQSSESDDIQDKPARRVLTTLVDVHTLKPYDPTQDVIFPPELQTQHNKYNSNKLTFHSQRVTWHRPTTLKELFAVLEDHPNAKLIGGHTQKGLRGNFREEATHLVYTMGIPQLKEIHENDDGLTVGGSVTFTQLYHFVNHKLKQKGNHHELSFWHNLYLCLSKYANLQIRNVATLAGSIAMAFSISDSTTLLMACRAVLNVQSATSSRQVPLDGAFYLGRNQTALRKEEIIASVTIPRHKSNERFAFHKVTKRHGSSLSTLCMGARVELQESSDIATISNLSVSYGGVGAVPVLTQQVSGLKYVNRTWDKSLLHDVLQDLATGDAAIADNDPFGHVAYRRCLVLSLFYQFYDSVEKQWNAKETTLENADNTHSKFQSTLLFDVPNLNTGLTHLENHLLGQPVPHSSSLHHTTGEAEYVDDFASHTVGVSGLHMALIFSDRAHAPIESIDASAALELHGVVACFTAKDVPENTHSTDEEVFARDKVTCVGQVVAGLVAEDPLLARQAATLVKVNYGPDLPAVFTIEEALQEGAESGRVRGFFPMKKGLSFDQLLQDPTVGKDLLVHEGEIQIAGQEHFYMETMSCLVVPEDGNEEIIIYVGTQNPGFMNTLAAQVLQLKSHKIAVRTKRVGGAFGGKETKPALITLPCVVAAYRLKRPVRGVMTRREDTMITGNRHPFHVKFKVAYEKTGKIVGLYAREYLNAGNTEDMSAFVACMSLQRFHNAYGIPNVDLESAYCMTNLPSNTAFRGFGFPQVMSTMESIVERVAESLNLDSRQVRETNLMSEGYETPYGTIMTHLTLDQCWQECLEVSQYQQLQKECEDFNKENRWKKRAAAIVPLVFGLALPATSLNQGFALAHVFMDGTVLLTFGGVEMGQGLRVKMLQVASHCLGLPLSHIHTRETTSDVSPLAPGTGGSYNSDLNGHAVMDACRQILRRLKPYLKNWPALALLEPTSTKVERFDQPIGDVQHWKEAIEAAFNDGVNLSGFGHYVETERHMDIISGRGSPYSYFTFGAACSSVEIDCLTGQHVLLSSDIVMDIGQSLNPGIDIGQIEGAFVQGYGMFTTEEVEFSAQGAVTTTGPNTYKIPCITNIPRRFRVHLLRESGNPATPKAVHSSKGIGEPPLLLGISAFIAIRQAIRAARIQNGHPANDCFPLNSPASAERIRLACGDKFVTNGIH